jgi:hypothetical protein
MVLRIIFPLKEKKEIIPHSQCRVSAEQAELGHYVWMPLSQAWGFGMQPAVGYVNNKLNAYPNYCEQKALQFSSNKTMQATAWHFIL